MNAGCWIEVFSSASLPWTRHHCTRAVYSWMSDCAGSLLWMEFLNGNGIHGSQYQEGLSSKFPLPLGSPVRGPSKGCAAGQGIKHWGWLSYRSVNPGEQLWDEPSSALPKTRWFIWGGCLLGAWAGQTTLYWLHYMSTKRRALTSLVMKGWWRCGWCAGIFAVSTDVLWKRCCNVV